METKNLKIQHNQEQQMFVTRVEGGAARLSYDKPQEKVLDFKETYVPQESRHQGVANTIVKKAFDFAKDYNYQVIPSCPFVKDFLDHHAQYRSLLRN